MQQHHQQQPQLPGGSGVTSRSAALASPTSAAASGTHHRSTASHQSNSHHGRGGAPPLPHAHVPASNLGLADFLSSDLYQEAERNVLYEVDGLRRSNALNDDAFDYALVVRQDVWVRQQLVPAADGSGRVELAYSPYECGDGADALSDANPLKTQSDGSGSGCGSVGIGADGALLGGVVTALSAIVARLEAAGLKVAAEPAQLHGQVRVFREHREISTENNLRQIFV